jgi:hypothetical protein
MKSLNILKNLKEFYMMKPFDLRAAKAGAPVCTRDGRSARIICTDCRGVNSVLALVDYGASESLKGYRPTGNYGGPDYFDLMMRDDDYAEKLARGEYGNHIDEATEKVDPVVKENLTVDREYWRRVYAGEIMPVVLYAVITNRAKIKDEYKGTPAEVAVARSAIALADALLEELEKTEKKL